MISTGKIEKDNNYVIMLIPMFTDDIRYSSVRWKANGKYIGIQERKHTYIKDEENIKLVYL